MLGAKVTGISLKPQTNPNHFDLLSLELDHHEQNISDVPAVTKIIEGAQPDVVFHLAAQALVRRSYADPLETFNTNVIGTANVLEACRNVSSVRAIVIVTTDKCYENKEGGDTFNEDDCLGGRDPYSASKAAAELVTAAYRESFFSYAGAPLIASVRAGNVIGGGDWSQDRLIPDLVRSIANEESFYVRSPLAVRPWQHVLEALSGYLMLGQRLILGDESCACAWNFGPNKEGHLSVEDLLNLVRRYWPQMDWQLDTRLNPYEAKFLSLDSTKARQELGWKPVWDNERTILETVKWYRAWLEQGEIITFDQISSFMSDSVNKEVLCAV